MMQEGDIPIFRDGKFDEEAAEGLGRNYRNEDVLREGFNEDVTELERDIEAALAKFNERYPWHAHRCVGVAPKHGKACILGVIVVASEKEETLEEIPPGVIMRGVKGVLQGLEGVVHGE